MFAGFEAYYRRITIFQFVFGLILTLSGIFLKISDPIFFSGMAVSFFGPIFLRPNKEQRLAVKADRMRIIKENKSIAWKAISLVYLIPLGAGLIAYYGFGKSFTASGFIFVGISALCSVLVNRMVVPLHKSHNAEVFD